MTEDERKAWDRKIEQWSRELAAVNTISVADWKNQETRLVAATLSVDLETLRLVLLVCSWYGSDFEDVAAPRGNYPPTFAQWIRELVEEKTGLDSAGGELWDFTVRDFVSAALDRVCWGELAGWLSIAVARADELDSSEDRS